MPQNGDTPLHLAAADDQSSVVQRLLDMGAATDATDRVRGKEGCETTIGRG